MPTKLTPEIIAAAILGFEEQKRHIDTKVAELRSMLSAGPAAPAATPEAPTRKGRRKMSAAARARIAEAQRRRWAASKKIAEPPAPEAASKPKRKLSRAGRAAIVAATKKRWALKRAEAAKAQKATKKTAPARKKAAVKKAAGKAPPAKAAKKGSQKTAVRKSAVTKMAPAPAQATTQTAS